MMSTAWFDFLTFDGILPGMLNGMMTGGKDGTTDFV